MATGREDTDEQDPATGDGPPGDDAPGGRDVSEGADADAPEVPPDRPDLEWDRVPDIADVHADTEDDLGDGAD